MGHAALALRKAHREMTYIPLEVCVFLCLCPCLIWPGKEVEGSDEGERMPQKKKQLAYSGRGNEI